MAKAAGNSDSLRPTAVAPLLDSTPSRYASDEKGSVFEYLRESFQGFSGTDCALVTPPGEKCGLVPMEVYMHILKGE